MVIDPILARAGFSEATPQVHRRMIVAVAGREKQGKTHFALTAPGPIAFFDLDVGTEGVVHLFTEDKDIITCDCSIPNSQSEAGQVWDRFTRAYDAALASPKVRTLVIDTATELWELLRLHSFGKLSQVMPHQYGPVNAKYQALIRSAYAHPDKSLILLHKMKPKYVNDKRTADYEASGFSNTPFLVQVNVQVERDAPGDDGPGEFHLQVRDCRQNQLLQGEWLSGPLCTFPFLATQVFPGSDLSDWE